MSGGYGEDLAMIHDLGHGDFAERATDEILRLLEGAGLRSGRVVDLGCGSGQTARRLLDAGYEVTGIDQSPAMIERARSRAPEADLRVATFADAEIPPCVAVTAVGEVLNYLLDETVGPQTLPDLFRRAHGALATGGLLVFDVLAPGQIGARGASRHRIGPDWAVLLDAAEDPTRRLLTREITSFRRLGELYRRDFEVHIQRLLEPAVLARQLRDQGFRVRIRAGYGDFRLSAAHRVLIARKVPP